MSTIIGTGTLFALPFGLPLGCVVFSLPSLGNAFLRGRPGPFEVFSAIPVRLTASLLSTIIGCADDDDDAGCADDDDDDAGCADNKDGID